MHLNELSKEYSNILFIPDQRRIKFCTLTRILVLKKPGFVVYLQPWDFPFGETFESLGYPKVCCP